jgi:hypothetical protein
VSTGDVIIAIVALIWGVSGLVLFFCVPFIELILMPWHRRRTGRELIEPTLPLPGQSALALGLCMTWPRFHRATGHVITIDQAPRWWRWIVLVTTWAGWAFLPTLIVLLFL